MRDIFGPQQAAKQQHRPSQWTCGFCGKSFYEEKYLELHFDNRHKSLINMVRIENNFVKIIGLLIGFNFFLLTGGRRRILS